MKKLLIFFGLVFSTGSFSQNPGYPFTPKQTVSDTLFNVVIHDEYRWMENLDNQQTAAWVENQNKVTREILRKAEAKIGSYTSIDRYAFVKYENPIRDGSFYFTYAYYNNTGAPALFCQKSFNEEPTVLVDPNFISSEGNIMLRGHSASLNSKHLAYEYSHKGSDWCEIRVIDPETGINRPDFLQNVKFSNIAWKDDGFYYSSYPVQGLGRTSGQKICFHKLGDEQTQDKVVFERRDNPEASFSAFTTADERFLILREEDRVKNIVNIFYIDYASDIPALRPLLTRLTNDDYLRILDNHDDELVAISFKNGNNGMVVKLDPANPRAWKILIPEFNSALLLYVKLLEDKIIALYQTNFKQQIVFFDYQGKVLHIIELPFGYSASGFNGNKSDKQILFSYSGYTQPKIVYILNTQSFEWKPLRATIVNFDFNQFETKELEYESFDGTRVPLFLIYQKGLDLSNTKPFAIEGLRWFRNH